MPLPQRFSLLVLGQGGSGLEVASWAVDHLGERVSSVTTYGGASSEPSDRTRALEARGARFVYGTEVVEGTYDICVASPGISEFSEFFRNAGAVSGEIMGEPEFAWRLSPERWCAITGTNGKTTVTSLTNELLRASGLPSVAVGNIGNVCIHDVDRRVEGEWFVAELSSYQIATTSELHPRVAVLLNITPDHLGWHKTHENYALAKIGLFRNMDESDIAIVNVEDEGIAAFADRVYVPGRRVLKLSLSDAGGPDAAFVRDGHLVVRLHGEETALVRVDELNIAGAHNTLNALAASTAALACGANAEGIRAGLVAFQPLPHRIEPVGEVAGVTYINDSKATNTDAVEKALTAFPNDRVILLLGGADKGTPLDEFMSVVVEHATAVVCFGAARERFRAALAEAPASTEIDIAEADDLRDAVDVARSLAQRGDVVLLSPACASFDEFSGFEERGDAFRSYVAELSALEG
ncbi:MAG: UDP-N-acetylmuramoyl-L-alanine--D-glutamate ligase [Collinsella sp.]|uniref:UDP-N-acetylmuramoyl-L-alanine--D-glutamate ligase n=1 Tax=Collinsella sp. TaxID=1965294 RepID=UPI002E791E04|nr:UDP-N-acetylmuramoyl-L-alanine--D-glutamate ligase [Collinsella sp.]MEE0704195.1 UDP-N-acetylmuramoyl-L-alanine--D-glutamate ligase [Collinsella sp.]